MPFLRCSHCSSWNWGFIAVHLLNVLNNDRKYTFFNELFKSWLQGLMYHADVIVTWVNWGPNAGNLWEFVRSSLLDQGNKEETVHALSRQRYGFSHYLEYCREASHYTSIISAECKCLFWNFFNGIRAQVTMLIYTCYKRYFGFKIRKKQPFFLVDIARAQ